MSYFILEMLWPKTKIYYIFDTSDTEVADQWFDLPNYHIPGGNLLAMDISQKHCIYLCAKKMHCVSVDYQKQDRACWYHQDNDDCQELRPSLNIVHIRQEPCPLN